MRKIFVTTVQLIILAEDGDKASDAVNNILTEADERLYDWNFLKVGDQRLTPTRNYGHTITVAEAMLREEDDHPTHAPAA